VTSVAPPVIPQRSHAAPTPRPVPLSAIRPPGLLAATLASSRPTEGVQLFGNPARSAASVAARTSAGTILPAMSALPTASALPMGVSLT
jgi:hypothetical protein